MPQGAYSCSVPRQHAPRGRGRRRKTTGHSVAAPRVSVNLSRESLARFHEVARREQVPSLSWLMLRLALRGLRAYERDGRLTDPPPRPDEST
jgi:hypothetical protein